MVYIALICSILILQYADYKIQMCTLMLQNPCFFVEEVRHHAVVSTAVEEIQEIEYKDSIFKLFQMHGGGTFREILSTASSLFGGRYFVIEFVKLLTFF